MLVRTRDVMLRERRELNASQARITDIRVMGITMRDTPPQRPSSGRIRSRATLMNSVPPAGLESVDHYPILVAVTGILVRILVDGDRQG